jgi:hypothetical protein
LQGFPRHEQPPQVRDEIAELNTAATALYTSYYNFDRFARRRLGR